jgi:hypothetical protein
MTISSQIIEVLNDLCRKFGMAIDWSQENIMPYLQELAGKYISWEVAISWMYIFMGVALLLVAIVLFVVEYKTNTSCGFFYFLSCILVTSAIVIFGVQVYDILTCKFFPEKQIIEYVHYLIQTKG